MILLPTKLHLRTLLRSLLSRTTILGRTMRMCLLSWMRRMRRMCLLWRTLLTSLLPRTSRDRKYPFVHRSGGRSGTRTGQVAGGGFIGSSTVIPTNRDGIGCTTDGPGDPLYGESRTLFFVTLREGPTSYS